jgi:hypothetical protein
MEGGFQRFGELEGKMVAVDIQSTVRYSAAEATAKRGGEWYDIKMTCGVQYSNTV